MSKFAKELGFFIISAFLACVPFLTGLVFGMAEAGELGFLTLLGLIFCVIEIGYLTGSFLAMYED